MTTSLHSTVSPSGKQRRRTAAKTGQRFPIRDAQKKTVLPTPATISKKSRNLVLFRLFAVGAMFFILLSTFSLWRKREHRRITHKESTVSLKKLRFSLPYHTRLRRSENTTISAEHHQLSQSKNDKAHEAKKSLREEELRIKPVIGESEDHAEHLDSLGEIKNAEQPAASEPEHKEANESYRDDEELHDSIEWYSRDDYKEGKRPMCRIARPIVLSNGTILVPDWMRSNEKLLRRCGLGLHGFYSSKSRPSGVRNIVHIDADFALTIHLERFQEPTHIPSVYLTEHVLKSSYLFDTFSGDARTKDGVRETHCRTTEVDTKCGLPRRERNILKPAIFVPRRIEKGAESSWPRMFVKMFGVAHGNGKGVLHLNASTILIKSLGKHSENLSGTSFRSVMTTDGMFRHLPVGALEHSNFYSAKNGLVKTRGERKTGEKCSLAIGIATAHDTSSGFDASSELKEKLEMLSKFAIPHAKIAVREIEASSATDFEEHIKQMQELDLFVAGSGDDMTSIGFLPSASMVFELMPFGINPDTHRSLARALNISYKFIKGKPQDESFKQCIDGEIFNLRKKGKLQFTETPEWKVPLLKAWDTAVGDFAMSGASNFDLFAAKEPVKNYYSRVCALKQKIEIGMDEAARQIITGAKEKCTRT